MSNYDSIDFFTDQSLVPDPHPYFDYLRSQNPVLRLPHYGVVAVTGYDEATEVYKDPTRSPTSSRSAARSHRCPSHLRATTSAADRSAPQ